MAQPQSELLGRVLKIYLSHALEWTLSKAARLVGHVSAVHNDGRKLEQYIRSALDTQENILCSVKGITVLVAVDRAQQALSYAIESCRRYRSVVGAQNAANMLRKSARLVVNMMLADCRGETELAETWKVAHGLLDAVLCERCATGTLLEHTGSLFLPSRPVRDPDDTDAAYVIGRKLWACDIVVAIVAHFKDDLRINTEHVVQAFQTRKRLICADDIQRHLENRYQQKAEKYADNSTAAFFQTAAEQVRSSAVYKDLLSQLAALPSTQRYTTLAYGSVSQCESPLWYLRAQGNISETQSYISEVISKVRNQHSTARPGSAADRFIKHLQKQYAVVVHAVQTSPLFVQPSGDLLDEYHFLRSGTKLIPYNILDDWATRTHCEVERTAAQAQRTTSAVHALSADIYTQAIVALDGYLFWETLYEWGPALVSALELNRSERRKTAHSFAQLADGLVSEVTRLNTATANSEAAGKGEAGQLWRGAADMQVKIAQRMFAQSKDALLKLGSGTNLQQAAVDPTLPHMFKFMQKLKQLAQLLDAGLGPLTCEGSLPGLEQVSPTDMLTRSVAHSRTHCASLQNVSSEHLQVCGGYHKVLEGLYEAFHSSTLCTAVSIPAALEAQLAALTGTAVEHRLPAAPSANIPAWVPLALSDCSALLMSATDRADLSAPTRSLVLQSVDHVVKALRPHIVCTTEAVSAETVALIRYICKAHVHAGFAALEGDLKLCSLFKVAVEQYERAQNVFNEVLYTSQHMDVALLVADRLLNHALTARNSPSLPDSTYDPAPVLRLCATEIERIVQLLRRTAELDSLCGATGCLNDSVGSKGLRDLCESARQMCEAAVSDAYRLAARHLALKNDTASSQRLEWHFSQLQECAKCFHEAAQVLADPQTPPALSRCLYSIEALSVRLSAEFRFSYYRIEPTTLARWYRNALSALKRDPTDAAGNAWLRAADKGAEVYDAEDRRQEAALVDTAEAVALCLRDIAVATAAQQTKQVVWLQKMLEQLVIVET
jgi:hypothetical protein